MVLCGVGCMRRIGDVFIAVCMVLIAGSFGGLLYLGANVDGKVSAAAALVLLTAMIVVSAVRVRSNDRAAFDAQIADLSNSTADLARQVADTVRRFNAMEGRVDGALGRVREAVEPMATEMGELGGLVRQIAEMVADHATALQEAGAIEAPSTAPRLAVVPAVAPEAVPVAARAEAPEVQPEAPSKPTSARGAAFGSRHFRGLSHEAIVELIGKAADANRIELYLQPIVALPQRAVRYYEALSRLRGEDGDVVPAGDFIDVAESAGLLPKLDNLLVFRCVQVLRRLQLKNREVGLFCNVGAPTLSDSVFFRQFLDFMEANRALAKTLIFEITQKAYRAFGPTEHEAMAALAERGFRFSIDNLADLRMDPKDLAAHWIRFLKVPAALLLDPGAAAHSDIHANDLADLLARFGVDLIAERVEDEGTVADLLDYDVRYGQGFVFSRPRPVRAEALQGTPLAEARYAPAELAPTGTG